MQCYPCGGVVYYVDKKRDLSLANARADCVL